MKVLKTAKLGRSFWVYIGITIKARKVFYETYINSKNSSSDCNCNKSTEDEVGNGSYSAVASF